MNRRTFLLSASSMAALTNSDTWAQTTQPPEAPAGERRITTEELVTGLTEDQLTQAGMVFSPSPPPSKPTAVVWVHGATANFFIPATSPLRGKWLQWVTHSFWETLECMILVACSQKEQMVRYCAAALCGVCRAKSPWTSQRGSMSLRRTVIHQLFWLGTVPAVRRSGAIWQNELISESLDGAKLPSVWHSGHPRKTANGLRLLTRWSLAAMLKTSYRISGSVLEPFWITSTRPTTSTTSMASNTRNQRSRECIVHFWLSTVPMM
jgi:hypothetical protein